MLGGLRLHWRVWWRRSGLDRDLAAGVDPISSDELSLRAGQLGSTKGRERLAMSLENVVTRAEAPLRDPRNLPPVLRRNQIRASRRRLLELADTVREADPLDTKTLAVVALMIEDGASPLYQGSPATDLAPAVCAVLTALDNGRRAHGGGNARD
jgi:hypothetical protein